MNDSPNPAEEYPEWRVDRWARRLGQPTRQNQEDLLDYRLRVGEEMIQQGRDPMSAVAMMTRGIIEEDNHRLRSQLGVYAVQKRQGLLEARAEMSDDLYPEMPLQQAQQRLEELGFQQEIAEIIPPRKAQRTTRQYQLWFQPQGAFLKLIGPTGGTVDRGELHVQAQGADIRLLGKGTSYPLGEVEESGQEGEGGPPNSPKRFFILPLQHALSFLADLRQNPQQQVSRRWHQQVGLIHHLFNDPTASLYHAQRWKLHQQHDTITQNQHINYGLLQQYPELAFPHFQAGRRLFLLSTEAQKTLQNVSSFTRLLRTYYRGRKLGLQDGKRPHPNIQP